MKGHMEKGKFHPHTKYEKGVRKSRDPKAKTQGVRLARSLKSTSSQLQWGFDLTEFKPDGFQKVLKELGIPQEYVRTWHEPDETRKEKVGRGFVWEGEGIKIETKNNPITGQYGTERMREPEINYAGYIGITGLPDQVKNAVKLIKKNTTYRKGESPNEREFI